MDETVGEIAIERALEGDLSVSLSAEELWRVYDTLESEGKNASEIAEILGIERRSVVRYRRDGVPERGRPGRRNDRVVAASKAPSEIAGVEDLIAAGKSSSRRTVVSAALRAAEAFQKLKALLDEDEERRRIERRIAELEVEIRTEKARLKSRQPKEVPTPPRFVSRRMGLGSSARPRCSARTSTKNSHRAIPEGDSA